MFIAEIKFISRQQAATQELASAIWDYACALYRQGQIAHEYSISKSGSKIRLHCLLPERCSLESHFHDRRGKAALRCVTKLVSRRPARSVIGEADETPPACSCRSRSSLHLFTHMFDDSSPLACGACGRPVPFYRLSALDIRTREFLLSWQSDYQACDRLFISSGFGEMWAYRQMSRLDSGLSKDGRELCAQVEAKLHIPVFYYLHKYWGRSQAIECKRLCPGCSKPWLLTKPQEFFDFRCEACRLLSSKAVDFPTKRN
ncbi:MAG: DUF2310 family Zn-ribbon-containing protein [Verrucomicrobia bacterium]|nr:DUF2310 family Zn-ribbon-containing protein [Verrucomicrobiota bacterium]